MTAKIKKIKIMVYVWLAANKLTLNMKKLSFSLSALDKDYPTYWRNKALPSMTLRLNRFWFLIKNLLVLKLIKKKALLALLQLRTLETLFLMKPSSPFIVLLYSFTFGEMIL